MEYKKKALIISAFMNYDGRDKYIDEYLRSHGYDTMILTSDFNHLTKAYDNQGIDIKNYYTVHVPEYKRNISIKRIYSHFVFSRKVKKIIKKIQPDFIYVQIPPNFLLNEIGKLRKKQQFKLVVDIMDLWPESFPKGDMCLLNPWRWLRDRNLNKANMIVLECDYYKNIIAKNIHINKIHTLYIIKDSLDKKLKDKWIEENKSKTETDTIRLAYLGSINNIIDIDKICDVVKRLKESYPVNVKIIGDGEARKEFVSKLQLVGATVNFYGKVFDEDKKFKIFSDCNFGINIYKRHLNIGLTLKSIDYFRYGLPLLNSIPGDTSEFVKKYGVGVNIIPSLEMSKILQIINEPVKSRQKVWEIFEEKFSSDRYRERLCFLNETL